jgi:glyoxylase-like metal-dependent hydrolase (beta-lactamase superfamily II)
MGAISLIHVVQHRLLGLMSVSKSFLIDSSDLVLIDTGLSSGSARNVMSKLRELERAPGDIDLCILTHRHRDHVGGLKRLKDDCGFNVAAHKLEAGPVEEATGVGVDMLLEDGQVIPLCGGIRVIHVPGHTDGNIALLMGRALFPGDSVFGDKGSLKPSPSRYNSNTEEALRNISTLTSYDFDALYPSHGIDITISGKEKLTELLRSL